MNRRNLLAFAALLPVLATPAGACSLAPFDPRLAGRQNDRVRRLFALWWEGDAAAFRAFLSERLMDDGSRMDPSQARALAALDPVPPESLAIFGNFFARPDMVKRLHLLVNTAPDILVGCSEIGRDAIVQPDCSGLPQYHLFLVTMSGLNPRLISHIASEESAGPDKASIWMESSARRD